MREDKIIIKILENKLEDLNELIERQTFEINALRKAHLKNLERIKQAEELLRLVVNEIEVKFEIVE